MNNLTLSVLLTIVIQLLFMICRRLIRVVKPTNVPILCGGTDAKHVCVLMPAIPSGAMAGEVIIMIPTLTNMERIHGVIPIGQTGNAIQPISTQLNHRVLNAKLVGSVLMDAVTTLTEEGVTNDASIASNGI